MEPQHLDPARSQASSANYFFYNSLRGLYKIDDNNNVAEEGGRCEWFSEKVLLCQLIDQNWSNGEPLTAQDYVRAFQHLVDPKLASPRANLLKNISKAPMIIKGELPVSELGVHAMDSRTLKLEFSQRDQEFLYKLASTALYPTHKTHSADTKSYKKFIVNGPYLIESWIPGKQMILKPNLEYKKGHPKRPKLKVHFIDDEMTAYRLYEKGKLQFLRRVPSQMMPALENRPDYFQKPMLRFDYIGFGEELMKRDNLRKALIHAIDYEQLRQLLGGIERPGCPSIPKQWLVKQKCFEFNLKKAKTFLSQVAKEDLAKIFQFKVSQLGGNDVKKQAVFIQNQWQKNLGIKVRISQVDSKMFIRELRTTPPDIFRKGVGLDRPTCYSALETFTTDSKRNYIQFKDQSYQNNLETMKKLEVKSKDYRKLCQKGINHLLDLYRLLPLGEMHFTLLVSTDYKGWTLNGLNQLDLSQVHRKNRH